MDSSSTPSFTPKNNVEEQLIQVPHAPLYNTKYTTKKPKMYGQVQHGSSVSQQSSDICLNSGLDSFEGTFKSSEEQISRVELYTDIPDELLREPEDDETSLRQIWGDRNQYVIWDAFAIDTKLEDEEIQEIRKNKILLLEVEKLQNIKREKKKIYYDLLSKRKAEHNIAVQAAKIFSEFKLQTPLFSQHYDIQKIVQESEKTEQTRQKAYLIAHAEINRKRKEHEITKLELNAKISSLQNRKKQLAGQLMRIQQEVVRRREERKQQMMKNRQEKQLREIKNLEQHIQKIKFKLAV